MNTLRAQIEASEEAIRHLSKVELDMETFLRNQTESLIRALGDMMNEMRSEELKRVEALKALIGEKTPSGP